MKFSDTIAGEPVRMYVLPARTAKNLKRWRAFLRHETIMFGLDVETTSIDEESGGIFDAAARMRMIQFGSANEAWCFDPHGDWRPEIIAALETEVFVSHTNYDALWVQREFGIVLGRRSIDTKVIADLLWPGITARKDLKDLTARFFDVRLRDAEIALTARMKELAPVGHRVGKKLKSWGFTNIPLDDEVFARYAGLDAICVRRLRDHLASEVVAVKMAPLAAREQRIKRQANRRQFAGMRVDIPFVKEVLAEIEEEYEAAYSRLETALPCSPGYAIGVSAWCEEQGMRVLKRTKGGNASLDKDVLPLLVMAHEDDPVLGPVLADKLICQERQNVLNNLRIILSSVDADGMVHPNINTQQAHTGRMSYTKPAMQTFKKGRLRGCFIAREGHVFVTADYDSQEIRIGAALSGDKALNRIVAEGLNQHVLTCEMVFAGKWKDKETTPEIYKAGKILDFAQQYGAGPRRIAAQLGVKVSKAKEMWEGWREAYSGLVEWTDRMSTWNVVTNPWGRRIPRDRYRWYANGNYLIQSSGRDMLGQALDKLEDLGWGDYVWMMLHDEIVLEVPIDRAEDACRALSFAMTCTLATKHGDITVPAEAEIIGHRWSGGE